MNQGGLTHVVVAGPQGRRVVVRQGFLKEAALEALIESTPELLNPIGDGLVFLPIGWQVPVGPSRIGFRLDLLFLASDGVLTLVETKLQANDESRREVIGQVLEYASWVEEWTVDTVRTVANQYLSSLRAPETIRGLNFDDAIVQAFGTALEDAPEEGLPETILSKLEASLLAGRLRVVCGVDETIESLERLVGYLSRNSQLDVILLQVNHFPLGDSKEAVLIPTLQGGKRDIVRSAVATVRLTEATLLESFDAGDDREAMRSLIEVARQAGASFEYGPSGVSVRAKSPAYKSPITVGWWYAPNRSGWMKTNDFSFGYAVVDYPDVPLKLKSRLEEYFRSIDTLGGHDASSKGVRAKRFEIESLKGMEGEVLAALRAIITDLIAAPGI
jgi:hypothetical protein